MTKGELLRLFCYDVESGQLRRKVSNGNNRVAGTIVGSLTPSGYVRTEIKNKSYMVHRLIWIMHYGDIPAGMYVDHIDRDARNNRISNLRLATPSQNQWNRGNPRVSVSGLKGVVWDKRRQMWVAATTVEGRCKYLGSFPTKEEAYDVYIRFVRRIRGEFVPIDGDTDVAR